MANSLIKGLIITIFVTITMVSVSFSQFVPAPPQTDNVITCFPDTSGYEIITVGPVDKDYADLQTAINAASPGTVLVLDAGVAFYGGFQLPDKGHSDDWIILTSSRMDLLPNEEMRINPNATTGNIDFPTQKDAMPKIITNHISGIPCFKTQSKAHHYRLVGLEITADINVVNSYGLINLGDGSSAQNTLDMVPHHFVIDRCFIHGHTNATIMKYGVRLDCSIGSIIDSYISDFHSIGFDAQAISGINGPGPFKIINNYLEASGENILFGGGVPAIPGLVPSDIEIRQNYFYKPWSWRVGHPEYAGDHWTIKNLFELKTGKRILLDGNILENSWADLPVGQSGYAILLTVRTENGNAPQADVSDVVISNNIIRHVGAGISLSGTDDGMGNRSVRIKIYNNLFDDVNGTAYGDQNFAGPNDGTFLKIGEPEDVWVDHNTIFQTGPVTWAYGMTDGFIFTNNLSHCMLSSGGYQGIYGPGQSQGNNTIAHYFDDITDANLHFHKNVFIGGDPNKYTNYNQISQNFFPADISEVLFEDFPNGISDYHGYRLSNESPFYQSGADGKNIGVDFNLLDSAMIIDRKCMTVTTATDNVVDDFTLVIYPNPSDGGMHISSTGLSCDIIRVYTLTGELIFEKKDLHAGENIDLTNAGTGMYLASIVSGGKNFFRKIFIHR